MRALQITELSGPRSALAQVDLSEPEPSHPLTPGSGVVVDVHAAGVSFPEVLQTRGEYQLKPELPFVPGSEVAGTVRAGRILRMTIRRPTRKAFSLDFVARSGGDGPATTLSFTRQFGACAARWRSPAGTSPRA